MQGPLGRLPGVQGASRPRGLRGVVSQGQLGEGTRLQGGGQNLGTQRRCHPLQTGGKGVPGSTEGVGTASRSDAEPARGWPGPDPVGLRPPGPRSASRAGVKPRLSWAQFLFPGVAYAPRGPRGRLQGRGSSTRLSPSPRPGPRPDRPPPALLRGSSKDKQEKAPKSSRATQKSSVIQGYSRRGRGARPCPPAGAEQPRHCVLAFSSL